MNHNFINILKNISYTIVSNFFSILVSLLIILVLPKLVLPEDYSYYQLFIFYIGYIGIFHLGWNDGIYLRYGGMNYSKLNFNLLNTQFIMFFAFQSFIGIVIIIILNFTTYGFDKKIVLIMVGLTLIIVNSRYMLIYILQATNRIKEFATIILVERMILVISVFGLLILKEATFINIILVDLLGKVCSFILAIIYCKEIVLRKINNYLFDIHEAISNIRVGIKLMIANFTSLLIIGCVMYGIERTWDVITFGKISLTLSICSFMMIFINAIGITLFPVIKRTSSERANDLYIIIRNFLGVFFLGTLFFYFLLKLVLTLWLPNYHDSFLYLSLVFPIVFFEGKMALLINTYMKSLRKEKLLLWVNIISFIISFLLTVISIGFMKNLEAAVFSIFILLAFRSILAEIVLCKNLNIYILKDIILELIVTFLFIICTWYLETWNALFLYFFIYLSYVVVKRSELLQNINYIRKLIIK